MFSEVQQGNLIKRRRQLSECLPERAILLLNGTLRYRNIAATVYPFRGSSHFVFCCGHQLPGACLLLWQGKSVLYLEPPADGSVVWHGAEPDWDAVRQEGGFYGVCSTAELARDVAKIGQEKFLTLPLYDPRSLKLQETLLGRKQDVNGTDRDLTEAMAELRLAVDEYALTEIRSATEVTICAHRAGMKVTREGLSEWAVCAEMEAQCMRVGMPMAYGSIVSVHGEVLHNPFHDNTLKNGDLLLADVGAESRGGYASDITRTWPVSGKFSPAQRDVYQVVLEAQQAAIAKVAPGTRFREVHLAACRVLAQGLVGLNVMQGSVDAIVESGAHAMFFPHGIGHLLGLDVHDLEDLGDIVHYESGCKRSEQFGMSFLRFDCHLRPGMVVTIEPGLYWIQALLKDKQRLEQFRQFLRPDRFSHFSQIRGIRIEDMVLVSDSGHEVLSRDLERTTDEIESCFA